MALECRNEWTEESKLSYTLAIIVFGCLLSVFFRLFNLLAD